MVNTITFDRVHLNFAGALKKLRVKKGMSQGDIFRKTGMERAYLSRLENGQVDDPRLTTIILLAKAMDISVDEFVEEAIQLGKAEEKGGGLPKKK